MIEHAVRVRACAKINIDLAVLGVRPDGYHEIRTTFQSVDLYDTLVFRPSPGPFRIVSTTDELPVSADNLIWVAARALWREAGHGGEPEGVEVHVDKRIPLQGGLGGGSADAAATLMALADCAGPARPRLAEMAANIGSDVPFFLHGGVARGTGRGDRLELLDDRGSWFTVLVSPPFGVSTVEAYRWFDEDDAASGTVSPGRAGTDHLFRNDLEPSVTRRHPEIAAIKTLLRGAGAREAAMSGSGSTVFGLFAEEERALEAVRLASTLGWRGVLTRTLSRREWEVRTTVERLPAGGIG